jgi:hypothetical protein
MMASQMKMMFVAFSLLGVAALAGCAEEMDTPDEVSSENAALSTDHVDNAPSETSVKAQAGYPGGSWVQSCPDRTVRYDSGGNPAQIIAYCYSRSHRLVRNGVWVWDCSTGCFWNDDGHLRCGGC